MEHSQHLSYPDPNEDLQLNVTTSAVAEIDDRDTATVAQTICFVVLVGLLMVFLLILCYWTIKGLVQCMRAKQPASQNRIQRRYETIEGWLISKKVKAHTSACETIQADHRSTMTVSTTFKLKQTASNDTAETTPEIDDELFHYDDDGDNIFNQLECPVCMECFVEDEVVSWSPSLNGCNHVFHHECIKEWLLHKDTCPYCRDIFLPVDNVHRRATHWLSSTMATILPATHLSYSWTQEELQTMAEQRSQRLKSTYFCLKDGLVTAPSNSQSSSSNRKNIKQMLNSDVQRSDLEILRGSRAVKATVTKLMDDDDYDDDVNLSDTMDTSSQMEDDINHVITHNSPQVLDYSCSVVGDIESHLREFQLNSDLAH